MAKLSEMYHVVESKREKAKEGFIRPTLGQLRK